MDHESKQKLALIRLGILGPLISARLEHGDRAELFQVAASRTYEGPDGRSIIVTPRTVEDWYYAWREGGLQALMPQERSDRGSSRAIAPELGQLIVNLKLERPRRSIRRIIKILERARKVPPGGLSKSSVHRFLRSRGLSTRPRRAQEERLAFRHPFAGDLWMGDVMHGPKVLVPEGKPRKAYLHVFVDSATRFVPSCAFRLGETAIDLEAVLKEAILKHGLPRVLYLDQGAAQIADSLRMICAELGIRLLHCRAYDPEAKGAVERFIRTVREEVVDELGEAPLELAELNGLLWSWLAVEYHRRVHDGTRRQPLEHWLSQASQLRPAPRAQDLDRAFMHRLDRYVREDGVVKFAGRLLEVRGELHRQTVELRWDPHRPEQLPQVFVDRQFYCDTVVLDVVRNSRRKRRQLPEEPGAEGDRPRTGLDPLRQIQAEHDGRVASPKRRGPRRQES